MEINIGPAEKIPGWMSSEELTWLAQQASRSKLILEVGVWKGRTTRVLADHTRGTVVAVDPWRPIFDATDQAMVDQVYADVRAAFKQDPVLFVRGTVDDLPELPPFDFIFIDGDHEEASVRHDIEVCLTRLRPGGKIAGHDAWMPGVAAAVRAWIGPIHTRPVGGIWSAVR